MAAAFRFLVLTVVLAGTPFQLWAQQSFSDPLAEQCRSVGQPQNAAWRTIPWQTDLIDAQHLAVEQQKPLFVWAMDGHPLGCT